MYIKDVRTGRGRRGGAKADIVREVALIYNCRSSPNVDKVDGVKSPENFADVLSVWSPERPEKSIVVCSAFIPGGIAPPPTSALRST